MTAPFKASRISNSWIHPIADSWIHLTVSSLKVGVRLLAVRSARLALGLLFLYEYGRRTVRALEPTAKAFCALSAHVAGAADSGNNHRCVVCWPRSIAFWRSGVER